MAIAKLTIAFGMLGNISRLSWVYGGNVAIAEFSPLGKPGQIWTGFLLEGV